MIDLSAEHTLSLTAAAAIVPPARGGRKTHLSTLLRWIQRGAKSPCGQTVHLEAVRLGGRWITSREALSRFTDRLTPPTDCRAGHDNPMPKTPGQRRLRAERAGEELQSMGI
jgi:hypothetical protein